MYQTGKQEAVAEVGLAIKWLLQIHTCIWNVSRSTTLTYRRFSESAQSNLLTTEHHAGADKTCFSTCASWVKASCMKSFVKIALHDG